ncbi:hypothetical protein CYLTODRAFT_442018 [Cylindrobasidium torrendii FP15055 ss-10]|uniref:F-box domain-containing protein n=1 Tax=Cylindrobasidium torrendii FP15055 ss-10 TaxID=1314674 RepID=A0A0D7BL44_9AGAR|nr:hypothetical protein CYLTODRAFT_442018 [Cylindrobasidium torrendii FP15055 ss-10]
MAPAKAIPRGLWSHIFTILIEDETDGIDFSGSLPEPFLLRSVCREWRYTVDQNPQLWTKMDLSYEASGHWSEAHQHAFDLALRMARTRALHITMDLLNWDQVAAPMPFQSFSSAKRNAASLALSGTQRSLIALADNWGPPHVPNVDLTALEVTIVVKYEYSVQLGSFMDTFMAGSSAQGLRQLHLALDEDAEASLEWLTDCDVIWANVEDYDWSHLVSLTIDTGGVTHQYSELENRIFFLPTLLSAAGNLEILRFFGRMIVGDPENLDASGWQSDSSDLPDAITLPHLDTLVVGDPANSMVKWIDCPALRKLDVDDGPGSTFMRSIGGTLKHLCIEPDDAMPYDLEARRGSFACRFLELPVLTHLELSIEWTHAGNLHLTGLLPLPESTLPQLEDLVFTVHRVGADFCDKPQASTILDTVTPRFNRVDFPLKKFVLVCEKYKYAKPRPTEEERLEMRQRVVESHLVRCLKEVQRSGKDVHMYEISLPQPESDEKFTYV